MAPFIPPGPNDKIAGSETDPNEGNQAQLLGCISFGADKVIRECNDEAERLLGWKQGEIIGSSLDEILPADLWENVASVLTTIFAGVGDRRAPTRLDAMAITRSGGEVPVEFTFLALEQGDEPMCTVLLHDLTLRDRIAAERREFLEAEQEAGVELATQNRQLLEAITTRARVAVRREALLKTEQDAAVELESENEQLREFNTATTKLFKTERLKKAERLLKTEQEAGVELTSENEQLRDLGALKDRFVAVVSHELRTPLTAIRGYIEIVLGELPGTLNDEQKRFLKIADLSSGQLLRVVDDLLMIGKIQAGHFPLEVGEVDLSSTLEACILVGVPAADAKQIELRLEKDAVPPIAGDEGRLSQALGNIISNAIKFTEVGYIDVQLFAEGNQAVIEIIDTGSGIPADEVDDLFVPFFRASTAAREAIPGTGLGLSIAKEIIEAHGGNITVSSKEGAGTTFRVELPAAVAQ